MFMGAPALGGVASTRLWPCAATAEATALSPAAVAFGFEADGAGGGAGGGGGTAKTRPLGVWTRKLAGWLAKTAARPPPAVPHGTQYARHARGWHAYGARTAVRTPEAGCPVPQVRAVQQAGTSTRHVRHGCGTAHMSTHTATLALTPTAAALAHALAISRDELLDHHLGVRVRCAHAVDEAC